MKRVGPRPSAAISCRPTCAVHPRSPRCCRSCTCGAVDRRFPPALEALLVEEAAGLSPTTIARLTAGWEKEYGDFRRRDLSGREYVYVWVDGIHFQHPAR